MVVPLAPRGSLGGLVREKRRREVWGTRESDLTLCEVWGKKRLRSRPGF